MNSDERYTKHRSALHTRHNVVCMPAQDTYMVLNLSAIILQRKPKTGRVCEELSLLFPHRTWVNEKPSFPPGCPFTLKYKLLKATLGFLLSFSAAPVGGC